jgi:uncharacterized protein YprB with RNaseH-like and TPR domain
MAYRAYLDIETTGLSCSRADLTVIGLCLEWGRKREVIQWVGDRISAAPLIRHLKNVQVLHTYNGARFDLPFIKAELGIDLSDYVTHKDLMYECWRRNLYGGLKKVEKRLGINRRTKGIDGRMAVKLWYDYANNGSQSSLALLLEYNKEDIVNLAVLRRKLCV